MLRVAMITTLLSLLTPKRQFGRRESWLAWEAAEAEASHEQGAEADMVEEGGVHTPAELHRSKGQADCREQACKPYDR